MVTDSKTCGEANAKFTRIFLTFIYECLYLFKCIVMESKLKRQKIERNKYIENEHGKIGTK
jgi:hypothetical protein